MVSELVPNSSNPIPPVPLEAELNAADQEELANLANVVALSDRTVVLFVIAPDSAPKHPVTLALKAELAALGESEFLTLHYSDDSLFKFLNRLDRDDSPENQPERRVVMAFGLEQLPLPRLRQEMQQLNLGRERIFERNLVLVFWLNRESFLDEFRSYAADFWDWHTSIARFTTRPPVNPQLYPYLEWMIAENSHLKMSGIMQVNRQVDIFLDQIYVSLKGEWVEVSRESAKDQDIAEEDQIASYRIPKRKGLDAGLVNDLELLSHQEKAFHDSAESEQRQKVSHIVDLADTVRYHKHSVILGDPGAGKTTLLRYLARHFALAQREYDPNKAIENVKGGQQEDLGPLRLPILFRIADYAERLATQPDLTLVGYLKQFYHQWQNQFEDADGEAITQLLLRKMAQGDCLLLLDGLDEVFDQANRAVVVKQIQRLVDDYAANKFVITSRLAGYREAALGSRFREFTITPMDEAQIEQFLQRWCLAIEEGQRPDADKTLQQRDAERETTGIMAAISTNSGVKRFATNPLLLTILALIHRNGTQLPQRRVELYELAAKTLIEDWQQGRNVPYGAKPQKLVLREDEVTELLAPLAFRMHAEKPSGLIEQAQAEEWLTPKMMELYGVEEGAALKLVRQFLRKVRETTGLFVERGPGAYGFMHLTFEEYFAARYIADHERDQILEIIQSHISDPRWEEPSLLALSYLKKHFPVRFQGLFEALFNDLTLLDQELCSQQQGSYLREIKFKLLRLKNRLNKRNRFYLPLIQPLRSFVRIVMLSPVQFLLGLINFYTEFFLFKYVTSLRFENFKKEHNYFFSKVKLAILALKNIEMSWASFSQLLRGVMAAEIIFESSIFSSSDSSRLHVIGTWLEDLRGLFLESAELSRTDMGLEDLLSDYLKLTSNDLLLDQKIQESSQRIFFELSNTYFSFSESETIVDVVERLNLDPIVKTRAVAYSQAGSIYKEHNKHEEAVFHYQKSCYYYEKLREKLDLVELFHDLSACYRAWRKYKQALRCEMKALKICQEIGGKRELARTYNFIGMTYDSWDKHEQAVDYYHKSLNAFQDLEDLDYQSIIWSNLAFCHKNWAKYDKAINCLEECLALEKKLENKSRIADIFNSFGNVYRALDKYEEAIDYYKKSSEIYNETSQHKKQAEQLHEISFCYLYDGKHEKAIHAAQQELSIRQDLDNPLYIAMSYDLIAKGYEYSKKYEEAITHYKKSCSSYEQVNRDENIAKNYTSIASLYSERSRYEESILYYEKSASIYTQLNNFHQLRDQLFNISVCYSKLGRAEEALEILQKSLRIAQKQNNILAIAFDSSCVGTTYKTLGKYKQAIKFYKKSYDIYKKIRFEESAANKCFDISACYSHLNQFDLELAYKNKELKIREKLGDQSFIAVIHRQLGRFYMQQEKYKKAISNYDKSRICYEKLEQADDVASQWNNLGICYRRCRQYEKAIACDINALNIWKEIENKSESALTSDFIGIAYDNWDKFEEAIDYYKTSYTQFIELDQEDNALIVLGNLANCCETRQKYSEALKWLQQCLVFQEKLEQREDIANTLQRIGDLYLKLQQYEEAISHYDQSRICYEKLEQANDMATQWNNLGTCYRRCGQYKKAIDCNSNALNIWTEIENESELAFTNNFIGMAYDNWDKFEEATNYYQISYTRFIELEQENNAIIVLGNLANCCETQQKYSEALKWHQQCLVLQEKLEQKEDIANTLQKLGGLYLKLQQYEEAIAHYENSRDCYEQLGLDDNIANQWRNLADCYIEGSSYEKAIDCALKNLEIRRKLDDPQALAKAYNFVGIACDDGSQYEQSIAHYQKSCEIFETLHQTHNVATVMKNMAMCYENWEKYEEALERYQKCLVLQQEADDKEKVASTHSSIAHLYHDLKRYEEAILSYQSSCEIYQELGNEEEAASLWFWIAHSYKELGEPRLELKAKQEELLVRQKLNDLPEIAQIYSWIGHLYHKHNQYEDAISYFHKSSNIYQDLDEENDFAKELLYLANSYFNLDDYTQALQYQKQGLAIHQAYEDIEWVALAFRQLGQIYKALGQYEEAINQYQERREINQQLKEDEKVAYDWSRIASCYLEWGKADLFVSAKQQELAIYQKLDVQSEIKTLHFELGSTYQKWENYESAITHYQQSLEIAEHLDLKDRMAYRLSDLAVCYRALKDYEMAIAHYQKSLDLRQALADHRESVAIQYTELSNTKRLWAKEVAQDQAVPLLQQANQHLQQALQLDTEGDYRGNLAYDHISHALLIAESLRQGTGSNEVVGDQIAEFRKAYEKGFELFAELDQTVSKAEEALEIARAYLEIEPLRDLEQAEKLAQQSLQTFQEFNRRKPQAIAYRLLGEISLRRMVDKGENNDDERTIATRYLNSSLKIYRELTIDRKVGDLEELLGKAESS